jgi:hypothetical protein
MWTSPDGKTHNHIEHILIDGIQHSSILDVQSFRGAVSKTNQYLMVAEVRERQAVSSWAMKKWHWEVQPQEAKQGRG